FSERFFSVFILGYFLFLHSPLWAFKYHIGNSTTTVLANGFLRGEL
ncbi:putative nef attachable protein, partial [Chlamydia psittaci C1/97]